MSLFRRGPRRETMPRKRPEPEANKVQAPEVVRTLTEGLGLRQMHTAPTVAAEIQPVVVVRDLSQTESALPVVFAQFENNVSAAAGPLQFILWNPPTHSRLVKVRRISWSPPHGNILNIITGNIADPPPATIKRGQSISKGRLSADVLARQLTPVGIIKLEGSVVGPTWYEQFVPDGTGTPFQFFPWERTFDHLYLGPGSALTVYTDGPVDVMTLCHFEWTEEPL